MAGACILFGMLLRSARRLLGALGSAGSLAWLAWNQVWDNKRRLSACMATTLRWPLLP